MEKDKAIVRQVKLQPTAGRAINVVGYCYNSIRPLYRDCGAFRKLFKDLKRGNRPVGRQALGEFLPILKHIEREAAVAIKILEELESR
jgi:hypothetical protein